MRYFVLCLSVLSNILSAMGGLHFLLQNTVKYSDKNNVHGSEIGWEVLCSKTICIKENRSRKKV